MVAPSSQYTSLAVVKNMSAGRYISDGDFRTGSGSVNGNYDSLNNQSSNIIKNTKAISSNTSKIVGVENKNSVNVKNMENTRSRINSNKNTIVKNDSNISANGKKIDVVARQLNMSAEELDLWQERLNKCL